MEPLHIFFHVATLGRWSQVYDHIIDTLEQSNILKNATLHVSVVGEHFDKNVSRYIYHHQTNNTKQYEFPTLNAVWNHSQVNDGAVLYLHTKGATRPGHTVDQWREMMLHFSVKKWHRAIHYLNEYDAVGCNQQVSQGKNFFSGNFWWAGCKYLRSLPDPNHFITQRIQGELWLGMNPRARFMNLHASQVDHYKIPYPSEKYQHL